MKVLVTGATGYIGSHVCKLLKQKGHYVEGWDINFHGEYNDVSFIDLFEKVDITNIMYNEQEFDAVVHLAGRSVVPQSLKEPSEYYRVNAMGTDHLLEKVKTPNFIFASTSSAFEMASPYARSKVAAEDIIKEKANGYTIFRFLTSLVLMGYVGSSVFLATLFVWLLWQLLGYVPTLKSLVKTILLAMVLVFAIIYISVTFAIL